jgi:hypothetical protein
MTHPGTVPAFSSRRVVITLLNLLEIWFISRGARSIEMLSFSGEENQRERPSSESPSDFTCINVEFTVELCASTKAYGIYNLSGISWGIVFGMHAICCKIKGLFANAS